MAKVNHKLEKWISHLFGRQRPRWFVWLFTEMCMVHVGSHRADSACAQLVLMLVSKPRVHIFTHEALNWLHHVLKVLGVGCWVALQVYLNLQKKKVEFVNANAEKDRPTWRHVTQSVNTLSQELEKPQWPILPSLQSCKTYWPWPSQNCLPLLSCPQNQRPQSSSAVSAPPTE